MATKKAAVKKKAPAKKAAAKKAPAKKAAAKKAPAAKAKVAAAAKKAAPAIKEKMTKTQIISNISESTGLSRKDVNAVMDEMHSLMERSLGKRAIGEFTVPGIMKITTVKKPARKARKGVNPFTGEEMMFKAKPATKVVKATVLKGLKDMV